MARKKKTATKTTPAAPIAAAPASALPPPSAAAAVAPSFAPLRPLVVDERLFATVVVVAVVCALFWVVRDVLVPLLFVGVVTFLGAPLVAWLERRGWPRAAGAAVFLVGAMGIIVALIAIVVPPLVDDIALLVQRLPALFLRASDFIEAHTQVTVPRSLKDLSSDASRELYEQVSPFAAKGGALVGAGALGLFRVGASAAGFVGKALLVPVIAFFLLAELPQVKAMAAMVAPSRARRVGARYVPLVNDALSGLVRGQLTVAALMSVIYVVGLGISGVPLAVGIGILAGAAYLIPFASASVALVLSVAFALLELGDNAAGPIAGAVITCVLVQVAEGYVLTPKIVGEKAGLSPLAALLAVLLGGSAAGFLGVLFALPVGAVVALVLREEVLQHQQEAVAEVV